ncbi:uncharacterized protein LOC133782535 [Humulus lupulus]|uniref:uncharacterized protein LOC133782535 n=1 Tax=Humulus lupulus TaxID=3486 RepID=UPI002B4008ED|nr:uncharacterized protein LOC133782535 [Humulus lupulus]
MKFLEFVSCCAPAATWGRTVRHQPIRRPEETRSLVEPVPRKRRRRKLGRLGAPGSTSSGSSGEWKPSLSSISEDKVIMEKREENRTVGSERLVKRKSISRSPRSSGGSWNYNDDYGRSAYPVVVPAFSPTPFVF